MIGLTGYAILLPVAESGIRLTGIESMSETAPEPSLCSVKSCNSKTFFPRGTETVSLPAHKAVVTTWSCLKGHIQQTEKTLIPDDWEDYVYPGVWTI